MRRIFTVPTWFRAPRRTPAGATAAPRDTAASHPDLARLRLHAALPADEFRLRFLEPVDRLAALLASSASPAGNGSALPASPCRLAAALRAGFLCFQAADGHVFSACAGVEARRRQEVRWRYLCFTAGLFRGASGSAEAFAWADVRAVIGPGNVQWLDAGGVHPGRVFPGAAAACVSGTSQQPWAADPHDPAAARAERLVAQVVARVVEALHPAERLPAQPPRAPALPTELAARVRDPLQAQRLAELAAACRALPAGGSSDVARTPDFLALALEFVVPIVRDLPRWVEAMAAAGFIHCPPGNPGLRVVPWVFAPGAQARPALLLSGLACRQLGL